MDQIITTRDATPLTPPRAVEAPRIYYVHPLLAGPLAGWGPMLDRARDLRFTHILSAPLVAGPSVLLAGDLDRPNPSLAATGDAAAVIGAFATACHERGLAALLDVVPDRVARGGAIARAQASLFRAPDQGDVLDPRHFAPEADAAEARFGVQDDELAVFWATRLGRWCEAGIDGFRLLLRGVPSSFVHALIARTRIAASARLMLGWTPGRSRADTLSLAGAGLDFVFSSLPWWDFASDWLWSEAATLARVAPVIASVEAPFEPRLAAQFSDPALVPVAQRRVLGVAVGSGAGWMMPMGFEAGATRTMDPQRDRPSSIAPDGAVAELVRETNAAMRPGSARLLSAPDSETLAFLRADSVQGPGAMTLVNTALDHRSSVPLASLLTASASGYTTVDVSPTANLTLVPGERREVALTRMLPLTRPRPSLARSGQEAAAAGRVGIERVSPAVDDGRFAAKRLAGQIVTVEADILCDGHDQLGVALLWRPAAEGQWQQTRMRPLANDRWSASFPLSRIGRYVFAVEAWRDAYATFHDELSKKHAAGIDVQVELIEGRRLIGEAGPALAEIVKRLKASDVAGEIAIMLSAEVAQLMQVADKRPRAVRTAVEYPIEADRPAAEFASWYEVFPRSMGDDPNRHGTFADVERHLPRIRDMGFDVLYFPPIHPIGQTNRKGRNNALKAAPGDVGSPYAIGAAEGGHDALHPELGTLDDFRHLVAAAADHRLELAIDFAIQCSPDHPWLKQHKGWFAWRPDGSMRYAENPPKKYEDIVNVDFYADEAIPGLWVALAESVMFWAEQGVRIFRVDNPHTKPFPFWEWMIAEVRARFPDALFLAEAFTRPKIMNRLGKIGFNQSYTYFTWRNNKRELQEYLTELATTEQRDFFRPNFFVNTPDINPVFLQTTGRAGHLIRAALATTLSGLWGVYSGFELCEATPLPGREEYLDSEKYQIRAWDWDRPGNIVAEITELNRIRRENPALHTHLGVTFLPAANDQVMFFEKATADRSNVVLVAISLDPMAAQSADIELPLYRWKLPDQATLDAADLVHGGRLAWRGKWQRVTLDPSAPYAIWRARPASI